MKQLITKDGMWLMSCRKSAIRMTTQGGSAYAYTGLYGQKAEDAKVFNDYFEAARVAQLLGDAKVIQVEDKEK